MKRHAKLLAKGHSVTLTIPASIIKESFLEAGDSVSVETTDKAGVITIRWENTNG